MSLVNSQIKMQVEDWVMGIKKKKKRKKQNKIAKIVINQ